MVSKHTEDRENYFIGIKNARFVQSRKIVSVSEIFERLLEADFPFDGIGRERCLTDGIRILRR
jgi:hypothetical protein